MFDGAPGVAAHVVADVETVGVIDIVQSLDKEFFQCRKATALFNGELPNVGEVTAGEYHEMTGVVGIKIDADQELVILVEGQIGYLVGSFGDEAKDASVRLFSFKYFSLSKL